MGWQQNPPSPALFNGVPYFFFSLGTEEYSLGIGETLAIPAQPGS